MVSLTSLCGRPLITADAVFLEQRRKGLQRFLNMLTNHPVTRDDGALNVFLTESSFESWRKRTKVSTDEESVSKRLNTAQEMGIPADLEEKLGAVRDNLPALLAGYQKLVLLAERSLARLQAASADASRIALSLGSVGEGMPKCCFRGERCSLCAGVGRGLCEVGEAWTRAAELSEKRVSRTTAAHRAGQGGVRLMIGYDGVAGQYRGIEDAEGPVCGFPGSFRPA